MSKVKKKVKRHTTLFAYIKEINKKFITREAKKKDMNTSEFVDAVFDKERKQK